MKNIIKRYYHRTLELRTHLSISSLYKVVAFSMTFAWIYFVNHAVGIDLLGSYYFAISLTGPLIILSCSGLPTTALKVLPEMISSEQTHLIREVHALMFKRTLLISLAGLICGIPLVYFFRMQNADSIVTLSLMVPFQSAFLLNLSFIRVFEKPLTSEYLRVLHIPLVLFLTSLLLWKLTPNHLFLQLSHTISSMLGWLISGFLIRKRTKNYENPNRVDLSEIKERISRLNKGFFKANLLNSFDKYYTTILIGAFFSNSMVGLYTIAIKVMKLPTFINDSLKVYLTPLIPKMFDSGSPTNLRTKLRDVSAGAWWINIPIWFTIFVFAPEILGALGGAHEKSILLLRILVVSQLIVTMFGYNQQLLSMTGHVNVVVRILIVYVFTKSVAIFFVTKEYDFVGIAMVTLTFDTLRQMASMYFSDKYLGMSAFFLRLKFRGKT